MELLIIVSCVLGFWMNRSLLVHSKYNWGNDLHALRVLAGFQVMANVCNLCIHLLLLIPWPFWGYAILPGDYLWTVGPVTCRLFTAIQEISSIVCIANAAGIFLTNLGKDELKKERRRKIGFLVVSITAVLSGILAFVYTKVIPILKQGTLSGQNCPAHSFSLLCGHAEVKVAFITYVACAVLLFFYNSPFTESRTKYILDISFKMLSGVFYFVTCCALVFGIVFIVTYLLGGSLYSVTFNIVKLYFDVVTLAVSIGFPAFLNKDVDQGFTPHTVQSSFSNRNPGNEKGMVKIRINTHLQNSTK